MTKPALLDWLAQREPAPPPALAARLREMVGACPESSLAAASRPSEALAALALFAVRGLASKPERGQAVALDLLAADAFVTYAFEATALDGGDVGELAASLLLGAET